MEQFNLRLETEQKEKWESRVEEYDDIQSVSELIRLAVEAEITDREKDDGQDLEEIKETLGIVLDLTRQLNNQADQIKEDTEYIEAFTATPEEIETIVETVFEGETE